MRWVKVSERKPSESDKNSIDAYKCVIARRIATANDTVFVSCRYRIEDLTEDCEWLEGAFDDKRMRWVSFWERYPDANDKTSVNSSAESIIRWRDGDGDWCCHVEWYSFLHNYSEKQDAQWLEGAFGDGGELC